MKIRKAPCGERFVGQSVFIYRKTAQELRSFTTTSQLQSPQTRCRAAIGRANGTGDILFLSLDIAKELI